MIRRPPRSPLFPYPALFRSEEWLYPRVQEALSAWTTANRSRHVVYRVIGERWDPRTHTLRDLLTRNSVPFEFYPRSEEHTSELQSRQYLVCRLLLEKKKHII